MISFANNPMLSATATSYPKVLRISTHHDNALAAEKADTFILTLYTPYHVLHLELKAAMEAWELKGGQQQGSTLTLQQLLKLLGNTKIQQWDVDVQSKFTQKTAEYKVIFPNRRSIFQSGTQIERISAVKVLSDAVAAYPSLADVKTDIDTFYTQLQAAFNTQKERLNTVKGHSEAIEAIRIKICEAQYANLGALMQKNAATPENILKYFDLSVLGNSQQVLFTGHLKPGQARMVVKHTFGINDQVWLANTGNTILKFYLSGEKDGQPGATCITLAHGQETELASALGKLTDPYLIVLNTDASNNGAYEIEIL